MVTDNSLVAIVSIRGVGNIKSIIVMKGTMTLKIVAAPNTKTEVLLEKTDAEMPITEMRVFQKIVEYIESEIDKLNN